MKVLCPSCERLSDFGAFRVEGAALFITCARCGVEHPAARVESVSGAVPAPLAVAPAAAPVEVPPAAEVAPAAIPAPYASAPSPAPRPMSLVSTPGATNVVLLRTPNTEALERAAEAAREGPLAVPPGCCPKCLAKRLEKATACPHCGLVFAMLDMSVLDPPKWLATAWKGLLESWGDDAKHEQLRKQASQGEGLAALGRLYRLRLAWVPEDPWAQRGRDEVLRMASATGLQRAPERNPAASGRVKLVAAVFIVVLTLLGIAGFMRVILAAPPQ